MMNIQKNIDKLLLALRIRGYEYYIDTSQFYSEKIERMTTKYVLHEGNPREGAVFFSKVKLLKHLVFIYKGIVGDSS